MRLDDEILVNRCLDGDQAAFSFLVNNYKEMVHAYAYNKVADYQEAQDIAQEVFIKAYKNLWQLKSPHKFQSWLYTIVSNECKMWLRKRSEERKRSVYIDDASLSDLDEISIRNHNDNEMHSTVMIAMKTLPDDNRLALSLYYMSDLSIKEIANFMGVSVNTVKGKLFRARQQLGERVNAMLGRELEKVKLQPGFILMVMDSIKNLPKPSMPKLPIIRLAPISITTLLLMGMLGFGIQFGKGNSPDIPTFVKYKVALVTNSNDSRPFGMNGNSLKGSLIAQNNNIAQDKGSINVDKKDTQKVEMNIKEQSTTSKSLENFPKLTWERQCTLCGSITACIEYLKEPFTYDYVMGVSGGAFKLLWYPPNGCFSNSALLCVDDVIPKIFKALGYQYNDIGTMSGLSSAITEDKAYEIAVQNIDSGKPFLVVGEEPYVVNGYEDKGKTLLGEAYWQWGKKTTDWYNKGSLITFGEKQTPPPKIDVLRNSLEWAIDLAEKPKRHPNGHDSGSTAYDTWIKALKNDEIFPKDKRNVLSDNYTIHVEITLLNLFDSRTQAVLFLKSMADVSGKGEKEIMSAVSDYEAEVILLKDMIKLALPEYPGKVDHSPASNQQREDNFADSKIRMKMADLLLQAEDKDKQAVGHLKLALKEL